MHKIAGKLERRPQDSRARAGVVVFSVDAIADTGAALAVMNGTGEHRFVVNHAAELIASGNSYSQRIESGLVM